MELNRKRSFDEMASSSSPPVSLPYLLSGAERLAVKKLSRKTPRFCDIDLEKHSFNSFLDFATKSASLKIAPSVVSLVSFSGDKILSVSCGTIVDLESNANIVVTSLNLIRKKTKSDFVMNALARDLKIVASCCDGKSYLAKVQAFDYHFNLLLLVFEAQTPLQPATCTMLTLEDRQPDEVSFRLRPHQNRPFKLKLEDPVVVVGRYFRKSYDLMAAPGCLRDDSRCLTKFDCQELLLSSCNITQCGDGAPVVNQAGEVIGIASYVIGGVSPFLPINMAQKWWNHYKEFSHPSIDFEASNMYSIPLPLLEKALQIAPETRDGLVIKKVRQGSEAEAAGLRKNDMVIKCAGQSVKNLLQLWNLMSEKVGETVELEVARVETANVLRIGFLVGRIVADNLNRWPSN